MEFSPKHWKGTIRANCCVSNCTSKKNVNTNLSFHRIPEPGAAKISRVNIFNNIEMVDKHAEWTRILKIKSNKKNLDVCSLHFDAKDYCFPNVHAKTRLLKRNAVPKPVVTAQQIGTNRKRRLEQHNPKENNATDEKQGNKKIKKSFITGCENILNDLITLSSSSCSTSKQNDHSYDLETRCTEQNSEAENHDIDCEQNVAEPENHDSDCEEYLNKLGNPDSDYEENCIAEVNQEDNDGTECKNLIENKTNIVLKDESVQVSTAEFSISFSSFIKNEKNLMTMCNIKSFAILKKLTELMDRYYPKKKKFALDTYDCIVLTTAKLKLDLTFAALSVFFYEISVVTVRNIFYDTVRKLARILQSTITRVPKEEIQRNMPKCFDKFQATTSVLDCTEVHIQTPKCNKCKMKFYSHYKGDVTVKFMTEVTPAGILVSVSESFGGRASDKTIFDCTGTVNYLVSTRDAIMVDKGFLIDNECSAKGIALIRPPFLKNQKQLTEEEALANREIAAARVHIERMNQRIKQFKVLSNKYPWHMINYIDDVFLICCGLANLGTPILADDKF